MHMFIKDFSCKQKVVHQKVILFVGRVSGEGVAND